MKPEMTDRARTAVTAASYGWAITPAPRSATMRKGRRMITAEYGPDGAFIRASVLGGERMTELAALLTELRK